MPRIAPVLTEKGEPAPATAYLYALLLVAESAELAVAFVLPPPLNFAIPAVVMPYTACQFLSDSWLQQKLLGLARRRDGRGRTLHS